MVWKMVDVMVSSRDGKSAAVMEYSSVGPMVGDLVRRLVFPMDIKMAGLKDLRTENFSIVEKGCWSASKMVDETGAYAVSKTVDYLAVM